MRPQDQKFYRTLVDRFCLPRPILAASVWAEKNLVLNEPKIKGPFTFIGREYLREVVDAWGPLPESLKDATDFSGCFGTGAGKTISCVAGLCYRIDNDPMRALVVKPTSGGAAGAKSFSKTRLQKAIRATPCLAEKIPTGALRHDFSSSQMQINGSTIDLTGSNSVGQLSENRCDVVLQDEIDKYPAQTETSREANPVTLADERTKSVPESRRYKFSTPTLDNTGIWIEIKNSDQRRYFMPCPHCNKEAYEKRNDLRGMDRESKPKILERISPLGEKGTSRTIQENATQAKMEKGWVVFAWSKQFSVFKQQGFEAYIRWDDKSRNADGSWNLEKVVTTAHAVCPHCEGKILNSHKFSMIKNGEWRATAVGAPGHVGWHLPSMYSTSRDCDFGQMAKKFLIAKHSLDGVKGFINSDLAEPDVNQAVSVDKVGTIWRQIEVTAEWINLMSVDYQQNAPYFWGIVRAWNGKDASHGLEYREMMQWHELDIFQKDHKVPPQAVIIDCGHEQIEVIRNCAELSIPTRCTLDPAVQDSLPMVNGWQPCKSFGGRQQFRNSEPETGRVIYQPYKINPHYDPFSGTDMAKRMRIELLEIRNELFEDMYENVRLGKTGLKWTISKELDCETYHQHVAAKIKKPKKKNPRDTTWVSRHSASQDHLHICEMLQIAMAYRLQLISFEAIRTKESKA
jgi:hypothetical protein